MKLSIGFFALAGALLMLGACVSPPPYAPDDAAIWSPPHRYGHGGTENGEVAPMDPPQERRGANRYGYDPREERTARQRPDRPPQEQFPPASGDNQLANANPEAGAPGGATDGSEETPMPDTQANAGGTTPPADNRTASNAGESEKPRSGGSGNAGGTNTGGGAASKPPADVTKYPLGIPVPGKVGFVTLPAPYAGLGEVDVRDIPPGTPVEIDDPRTPGKKIYFRVP